MAVHRCAQSEMRRADRLVFRLHHAPQKHRRNDPADAAFVRFVEDAHQLFRQRGDFLHGNGRFFVVLLVPQTFRELFFRVNSARVQPEIVREYGKRLHFFAVGFVVRPVQAGKIERFQRFRNAVVRL